MFALHFMWKMKNWFTWLYLPLSLSWIFCFYESIEFSISSYFFRPHKIWHIREQQQQQAEIRKKSAYFDYFSSLCLFLHNLLLFIRSFVVHQQCNTTFSHFQWCNGKRKIKFFVTLHKLTWQIYESFVYKIAYNKLKSISLSLSLSLSIFKHLNGMRALTQPWLSSSSSSVFI